MSNGEVLDLRGMKCLKVTWNLSSAINKLKKGTMIKVIADCPTFSKDVKRWCQKHKKVLMHMKEQKDGITQCQIKV